MKDLLTLLESYPLEQIIMFIVLLALAFKGIIDFFDWGKKRVSEATAETQEKAAEATNMKQSIDKLFEMQVQQTKAIDKLTHSVDILLQSDKDDIKSWITAQHHYFCYEVKYIDDYSLDCIERRYAHYVDEGGNSFIGNLMIDLRSLKKVSSTLIRSDVANTQQSQDNKK